MCSQPRKCVRMCCPRGQQLEGSLEAVCVKVAGETRPQNYILEEYRVNRKTRRLIEESRFLHNNVDFVPIFEASQMKERYYLTPEDELFEDIEHHSREDSCFDDIDGHLISVQFQSYQQLNNDPAPTTATTTSTSTRAYNSNFLFSILAVFPIIIILVFLLKKYQDTNRPCYTGLAQDREADHNLPPGGEELRTEEVEQRNEKVELRAEEGELGTEEVELEAEEVEQRTEKVELRAKEEELRIEECELGTEEVELMARKGAESKAKTDYY